MLQQRWRSTTSSVHLNVPLYHVPIHQRSTFYVLSQPAVSVCLCLPAVSADMPRKAAGKRQAASTEEQPPSTPPKKTRQRRSQPASAPTTPVLLRYLDRIVSLVASSSSPTSPISSSSPSATGSGSVYRLRVHLLDSSPPIWRRVLVHSSITLDRLHTLLQVLFDWEGCHLHLFAVSTATPPSTDADEILWGQSHRVFSITLSDELDRVFSARLCDELDVVDGLGQEDERAVTLREVMPAVDTWMMYEYDTGDCWDHAIQVEAIEPATQENTKNLPLCTSGRCSAPGEDTGGMHRHRAMVRQCKKWMRVLQGKEASSNKRQKRSEYTAEEHEDDDDEEEAAQFHVWLDAVSERLGFDYHPLYFDRKRVNRNIKECFAEFE